MPKKKKPGKGRGGKGSGNKRGGKSGRGSGNKRGKGKGKNKNKVTKVGFTDLTKSDTSNGSQGSSHGSGALADQGHESQRQRDATHSSSSTPLPLTFSKGTITSPTKSLGSVQTGEVRIIPNPAKGTAEDDSDDEDEDAEDQNDKQEKPTMTHSIQQIPIIQPKPRIRKQKKMTRMESRK